MNEEYYSCSKIYTSRIPILGKPRDIHTLKRIIADAGVKPVEYGAKNSPRYRLQDIEDAFKIHLSNAGRPTGNSSNDDEELVDMKREMFKAKLQNVKNDNKLQAKELEKKDLQIEQLKARLVDYEECYRYLVSLKSILTALVRRILITDVPMSVCGLEVEEARPVCETLYNEYIHALINTTNLWRKKYAVGNDREFELEIEKEIRDIINGTVKKDTEESK